MREGFATNNDGSREKIIIREAQREDVQEIVRIYLQGFEASWGHPPTRATEEYFDMFQARVVAPLGHSRVWVATLENRIVGWQALQDLGFVAQSSTYIDVEWHKLGVGRLLLAHAQREAEPLGFSHIVGWIRKENAQSIKLVRSLDWQFFGCLPRSSPAEPEYVYYSFTVTARNDVRSGKDAAVTESDLGQVEYLTQDERSSEL
jgi:L-amino acid N-acyltransferase YncA